MRVRVTCCSYEATKAGGGGACAIHTTRLTILNDLKGMAEEGNICGSHDTPCHTSSSFAQARRARELERGTWVATLRGHGRGVLGIL